MYLRIYARIIFLKIKKKMIILLLALKIYNLYNWVELFSTYIFPLHIIVNTVFVLFIL